MGMDVSEIEPHFGLNLFLDWTSDIDIPIWVTKNWKNSTTSNWSPQKYVLTKATKDWKQLGNLIKIYFKKNYKKVKEIGNN